MAFTRGILPQKLKITREDVIKRLLIALLYASACSAQQNYTGCSLNLDASMNITATCPSATIHGKVNPIALVIPATPSATVGQPFSMTLGATGGIEPYNFTVTSGTLPAGLSLVPSPDGKTAAISGKPSGVAPGKTQAYTFTVTVTDKIGGTTSAAFQSAFHSD
jgi:hypothetical protein